MYTSHENFYRTPEGEITTEAKGNTPVAYVGTVMSKAAAAELGLPEAVKPFDKVAAPSPEASTPELSESSPGAVEAAPVEAVTIEFETIEVEPQPAPAKARRTRRKS